MRVFHFLNAKYGLEALRNRRLKISQIGELNDPFELLGVKMSDPDFRKAFLEMKLALSKNRGLHCFSKSWSNPVLWSHYADKHRGLCLAFDVPNEALITVTYTRKRLDPDDLFSTDQLVKDQAMIKILGTKFLHWRYEDEVRQFVSLADKDPETGHYFSEFSEQLKLALVVVGTEACISRSEISAALGEHNAHIKRFKARPAYKTFRVVRKRTDSLWV